MEGRGADESEELQADDDGVGRQVINWSRSRGFVKLRRQLQKQEAVRCMGQLENLRRAVTGDGKSLVGADDRTEWQTGEQK